MVEGMSALRRRWLSLPDQVRSEIRRALEKTAEEMVDLMRRAAPKQHGDLAASIDWTWGAAPSGSLSIGTVSDSDDDMRITIFAGNENTIVRNKRGVEFQNALLQEFGTESMPASPYFFPSYRLLKKRGRDRINRAGRAAFRRVAGG